MELKSNYSQSRPPSTLSQKPSIVEVISPLYTVLRKSGREWVGLCRFHEESTPSFYVNEDKGLFLCRGCGVAGDVIRFIEMAEHLSFNQALAHLGMSREKLPA